MKSLKILDSIILLSWFALLLIIIILAISLSNRNKEIEPSTIAFCGTSSIGDAVSPSDSSYSNYIEGKDLFRANCATCHNKNMVSDMTGPALKGVRKRWDKYPKEDLYDWIRNSQKLIQEKHPRALILWEKWNPTMMNSYPNLSNEEIEKIFLFIEK